MNTDDYDYPQRVCQVTPDEKLAQALDGFEPDDQQRSGDHRSCLWPGAATF